VKLERGAATNVRGFSTRRYTLGFCGCFFAVLNGWLGEAIASSPQLDAYNVVWDSPSQDCHGFMPIGNGDLAANVWLEPTGDLVFYSGYDPLREPLEKES